ncbi:MAG: hypothetical protein IJ354_09205 [Clostridia bacterium]|nr:hypothetical protein [Clostridia bacterium]
MKKQCPVLFYLRALLYTCIALFIRVAAFAPLLFMAADSAWKYLALLCPVMLVFVVLPLRFSFAQAMVQRKGERFFSFDKALSLSDYTEKLLEGLLHMLNVLKWGLPLAALCGVAYYYYTTVDALTVLTDVTSLGKSFNSLYVSVANVFGANMTPAANTLMDGVLAVGLVVALTVLIWLYGAVRNSSTRYIWAIAAQNDRVPRKERRRRLRGRRFQQLLVGIVNAILFVPFVAVIVNTLKSSLSGLSNQLMLAIASGKLPEVDFSAAILPVVLAFALLYLPILPIRRWLTAAFASGEKKQKAKSAATAKQ